MTVAIVIALVVALIAAVTVLVIGLNHRIFDRKLGGADQRRSFTTALRTGTVPSGAPHRLWSTTLHEGRSTMRVAVILYVVSLTILTPLLVIDLMVGGWDPVTTGALLLSVVSSALGVGTVVLSSRRHGRLLAELERLGPVNPTLI